MKYGQTWWGGEWLNALSHIDYSNRLPRGRAYANKGAVKEISIDGSTIYAKVQGTRRSPYKISVKIPAFSTKNKQFLTDTILNNPLLLSKLLNRELPISMNKIAEANNIRIFPQKWDDLSMDCSCPDWAVPCKHLAAVINVIANEIDRNPFVIFKLHNYDIIEELKNKGMEAIREAVLIPKAVDLFLPEKKKKEAIIETSVLENIDFSVIEDMREKLLSLLDENPVFYSNNFKGIIDKIYKKTSKGIIRELKNNTNNENRSPLNYERYSKVRVILEDELFYAQTKMLEGSKLISINNCVELISFLSEIPAKYITRLSPELLLLFFVYHFALKIVEKSAFIPQILQLLDKSYAIRWIPALINEKVKIIFDNLVRSCPSNLVISSGKTGQIKKEEQIKILTSIFIKQFIKEAGTDTALKYEPASHMFIDDFTYKFDKLGEKEIPGTIQRWIDNFYLAHNTYIPVLEVDDEADTGMFRVKILIENSQKTFDAPIPLEKILTQQKYKKIKIEILRNLDQLTRSFPALEQIIVSSGKKTPTFNSDEFAEVLLKILPIIKLYGIKVILPNALKDLVRPKISVSLSSSNAGATKSFLNLEKILDFKWKIALGDTFLGKDEFLKLVHGFSGIVKIKQQYVYLDQADLKALMESISKQDRLNRDQLLQAAISGEYNGAKISLDREAQQLIDSLLHARKIDLPGGLQATLRPYQQRGYEWLFKNTQLGFGSIIADDMGLGKTLQVIAIILKLKLDGELKKQKVLVIVPTTLITNWQNEIDKFAPSISYSVFHGQNRKLNTETDVVITSYGIVRSEGALFAKRSWKMVIIDEAQNIKNAATAQTNAVKKLKSNIRIAMSGTPVENRLSEYWSIFDFINKGYLGNIKKFSEEFATPIEVHRNKTKLDRFLKITSPFILRRLKSDKSIISDLPEKNENDYIASLCKEQAAIYQNVLNTIMAEIENTDTSEKDGNIQRRGLVLKLIMALKQICNHPSQYLKKEDYSADLSGKANLFMSLIENIIENDEKVLVFTQFKEMGIILQHMIKERFNTNTMFLHGGVSRKKRDEMVEQFQNNLHEKIFILSIKAGGTGLNLTAANHVVHYDLWWNPAVEAQATDRAYRIGQNKNVMVYRLITKGTFEEKINKMLIDKKELANLTVSTGEKWIGELPNSELKELFSL